MIRGPIAEVNLSAIAQNLHFIRQIVQNRPVIAVVKADAYGHGAVEVSKKLIQEKISYLAVAYTGEARELRGSGINAPIIVLFDRGDLDDFFDFDLIPVVSGMSTVSSLSAKARKRGAKIKVHVKVDTGMGRMGLSADKAIDVLARMAEMPGIEIDGLLSHFSEADLSDRSFAIGQLEKFNIIRDTISQKIKRKIFSHIANSAAVLSFEDSYLDAVRPGIMLYGYSPFGSSTERSSKSSSKLFDLVPAMSVKTRILCIREVPSGTPISYGRTFVTKRQSRIGVLPMGYADGYSRLFSNNADVLVKGKRAPVVGRVCMDLTMVDLTDIKDAGEDDEVIILGKHGDNSITAQELAERANTIPYEILTSLGKQAKRIYVETD